MEFSQIRNDAFSEYTKLCERQSIVLRQLQAISIIEQDLPSQNFNHAYRELCEVEPALNNIENPKIYCADLDQTRRYFLDYILQLETSKITLSESLTERALENRLLECFHKTLRITVPHSRSRHYLFKQIYNGRFPADLTLFKSDSEDILHNFVTQGAFLYSNEEYLKKHKSQVIAEIQEQQAIKQRCEYTLYNEGITTIKKNNKEGLFFYSSLKTLEEEQIQLEKEIDELEATYNPNKEDQKLEIQIMKKLLRWFKAEFQQQAKLSEDIDLDIIKAKYKILFNALINKTNGNFDYRHEEVLYLCNKFGYTILPTKTTNEESIQPLFSDLRYTNIVKDQKLEELKYVSKIIEFVDCSRKGKDRGFD